MRFYTQTHKHYGGIDHLVLVGARRGTSGAPPARPSLCFSLSRGATWRKLGVDPPRSGPGSTGA
jgi:hypothetical protein